jgi:hypothetical protein
VKDYIAKRDRLLKRMRHEARKDLRNYPVPAEVLPHVQEFLTHLDLAAIALSRAEEALTPGTDA